MQKMLQASRMPAEEIRCVLLKAYRLKTRLPKYLAGWIRKREVRIGEEKPFTEILVKVPAKITHDQWDALQTLVISAEMPKAEGVARLCTVDDVLEKLVKNGAWNGLWLENYLNAEGTALLARDLHGRRGQLKGYGLYTICPSVIRTKLLKTMKNEGYEAPEIDLIPLSWVNYFYVKDKLVNELERYSGIMGMLRLAKELKGRRRANDHLGHLFMAGAVIGKVEGKELGWQEINLPYKTFQIIKRKIMTGDYYGIKGMLRLADELKISPRDLVQVGSAMEKAGKIKLNWQHVHMPYPTFMEIREKIKTGNYYGIEGMLRLAKELGGVHLGNLHEAGSVIEKVEKVELGWYCPNLPYSVYSRARELLLRDKNQFAGRDGWKNLMKQAGYERNRMHFVFAFKSHEAKGLGWVL